MMSSRKFRIVVVDAIFSALIYLVTWYVAPDMADKVLIMLGLLQGSIMSWITGIAIEDAGAKINGTHPTQLRIMQDK